VFFGELERRRQRGQARLGGERVFLAELRQPVRGDQAAARGLRPVQRAIVRRLHEGGVVGGERELVGGQAARGGAHHPGFPFGGGQFEALPAQHVVEAAGGVERGEDRIAFVRQRLAAAAPDRLCVARPLRVRRTGTLAGLQLGDRKSDV